MSDIDVPMTNAHHRVGHEVCVRKEYRMLTLKERRGKQHFHLHHVSGYYAGLDVLESSVRSYLRRNSSIAIPHMASTVRFVHIRQVAPPFRYVFPRFHCF